MKAIGLAAVAACLVMGAGSAYAAEQEDAVVSVTGTSDIYNSKRENISLQVSTAGVDFSNAQSVADFRADVRDEILKACAPKDRVNTPLSPDWQCRRELSASFENAVMGKAARAYSQQASIN